MKTLYGRKSNFAIEDGPEYVGYTTEEMWKVYACPYFEKEVIEQIFIDIEDVVWGYNEREDYFNYHLLDHSVEDVNDLPVVQGTFIETIEGTKHVYQLGAGSWIWTDKSNFEKYILSASTSHLWKDEYIVGYAFSWEQAQRWIDNRMKEDKCTMITIWQKEQYEEAEVVKKIYTEEKDKKDFYSFETMRGNLKEKFIVFLKENNIYYELSGCDSGWHFEINCNQAQLDLCNNFLERLTIIEQ
jgi:hypothetical protein